MSVPPSLQPSPIVSLGDHSYKSLFEDDFSVNKFVLKTKASSSNKGVINYKGTYDCEKDAVGQEVKIQFPWRNYYVWLGVRPTNHKLHIDFGEFNFLKKWNLYANARHTEAGASQFRVGVVHNGKCNAHIRTEYNNNELSLTTRALAKEKDFVMAGAASYNISLSRPDRYDFLLGLQKPDFDLYLRHYSNSDKIKLGNVFVDFIYRKDGNQFGTEVNFNQRDGFGFLLGWARRVNGYNLKLKYNFKQQQVFASVKGTVLDTWNLTLSGQLPFGKSFKQPAMLPIPISVTLETSI